MSPTFKVLEQKKFCRFSLPTVGKYWKHKISKNKDSQLSYDYDSSPPPQSPVNLQDNTKTKLPVARQPSFKFYQRIRSFIPKKDTLLEDKQDDIEKNLRGLLEKPDDEKTAEEIREEKRLMALRIEIVRLKNELVYREENKRLKDQ